MRRNKIILILAFIGFFISGQAQEYHPIIRPDTYWDVYYGQYGCDCFCNANRYFFGEDTVIDNKTYKKIYAYEIIPVTPPEFCPPFVVDTVSFLSWMIMREDTLAEKVFVYDINWTPPEQLLYDFSLQVGDTLYSEYVTMLPYLIVTHDTMIMLENGELRKRLTFDNGTIIIESIGSECGLFEPYLCWGLYWWTVLHCVLEQDISIFGNSCPPYLGLSNPIENIVRVFPNPADDIITIQIPDEMIHSKFNLFNQIGRKIFSITLLHTANPIFINGLAQGLYIYSIRTDVTTITGKLILN
ncbi:MAG: T9SS type A sorting domain-containing protein [bacterium]